MQPINLFQNKTYRNIFIGLAAAIFFVLFCILYAVNMVPDELLPTPSELAAPDSPEANVPSAVAVSDHSHIRPVHVSIPSVGIDTKVTDPNTVDVEKLDTYLQSGAAYYPSSGSIESGNMLVFGHSTSLAIVHNQAYRTFNGLKLVEPGAEIFVTGEDGVVYVYKAISEEMVKNSDALVQFNTPERMITLSTCNTLGAKEDRNVVKAVFDRVL